MAIFKDKTGRGEVDYVKVVRSENGTKLLLDGTSEELHPFTPSSGAGEVIFQLRGETG